MLMRGTERGGRMKQRPGRQEWLTVARRPAGVSSFLLGRRLQQMGGGEKQLLLGGELRETGYTKWNTRFALGGPSSQNSAEGGATNFRIVGT